MHAIRGSQIWLRDPRACNEAVPSGFQTLGHPSAYESHGRSENRGPKDGPSLGLGREEKEAPAGPADIIFSLMVMVGLCLA